MKPRLLIFEDNDTIRLTLKYMLDQRGYEVFAFPEGTISGEVPLCVAFPPRLTQDHALMIPLERFGIRNLHLTALFRPTGADEF